MLFSTKAPAKINLGLYITGKRQNGYHELESIFLKLELHDLLKFDLAKKDQLIIEGPFKEGVPDDDSNLVMMALNNLRKYKKFPPLKIILEKRIPNGAGLGGGSSDAANLLKSINNYFKLEIKQEVLKKIAEPLGADISFFLEDSAALVKGIGEKIYPFRLKKTYKVIILCPNQKVSTKMAYSKLTLKKTDANRGVLLDKIAQDGLENANFLHLLHNDLETASIKLVPQIQDAKRLLQSLDPYIVMMSGSGSSVFALFEEEEVLQERKLSVDKAWFYYTTRLLR